MYPQSKSCLHEHDESIDIFKLKNKFLSKVNPGKYIRNNFMMQQYRQQFTILIRIVYLYKYVYYLIIDWDLIFINDSH